MERRFAVHARPHRQALTRALVATVLASSGLAVAAPKTPRAKAAFTAGVKAYQKGNYGLASQQLAKSYALEKDVETLFAWAQTERQLERCDKASELYVKILAFDLPAANKQAVQAKLDECKAVLHAPGPGGEPAPAPVVAPEPAPEPAPPEAHVDAPPPPPGSAAERPWWKDPVGLTAVGLGAVATGIGTYYLVAGNSAHTQMVSFDGTDRAQYLHYRAEAESDGKRGVIASAVGGGLLVVGVIWFATHRAPQDEAVVISGWIAPSSSGLALGARF